MTSPKRVDFVTRILTHYRAPFHENVRALLAERGIEYNVFYGSPTKSESLKGDLADLSWGRRIPSRYFFGEAAVWLSYPLTSPADLTIIGQESRILSNYAQHVKRIFDGRKLAYFGHGRNFQTKNRNSAREKIKRSLLRHVDWWFAYTDASAKIVADAGFSARKITTFNNTIDSRNLVETRNSISDKEISDLRGAEYFGSDNIGIYIGGLYSFKRIDFLVDAATLVRQRIPDFQLIVVGGGEEHARLEQLAASRGWLHVKGPLFGREKILQAALGSVFLMPGLVGLGVIDAFALAVPMVTCDLPFHSPEIEYLVDGMNGRIVEDSDSTEAYADAVVELLLDRGLRSRYAAAGRAALEDLTIERMAARFSEGVVSALSSPV